MKRLLLAATAALVLAACGESPTSPAHPALRSALTSGPNLVIYAIYPGTLSVTVRVCNNGDATAAASYLRLEHFWSPWVPSNQAVFPSVSTPSIAAGLCANVLVETDSDFEKTNELFVWIDYFDDVAETDEGDNYEHVVY